MEETINLEIYVDERYPTYFFEEREGMGDFYLEVDYKTLVKWTRIFSEFEEMQQGIQSLKENHRQAGNNETTTGSARLEYEGSTA